MGPKRGPRMIKRHRWELTPEQTVAVGDALVATAAEAARTGYPSSTAIKVDLDEVIARVAPNATRIEYEVPAVEMETGDGLMGFPQ